MVNPSVVLENFLQQYFSVSVKDYPLLLALSGGADSLCLFHCLLDYKEKYGISFNVAHVDHGWRCESGQEADELELLAQANSIPFHRKRLDLSCATGNLEDFCRNERYAFFCKLTREHSFQAVLIAHHGDDQGETVLKRFLEGAHWSRWGELKSESTMYGIKVLRPFLSLKKQDIRGWLKKNNFVPYEDRTNEDTQFLRARMRHTILPDLAKSFGKNIHAALISAGNEAQELTKYFDEKIQSYLTQIFEGPFGIYLDLSERIPDAPLEIKYLIKKFCELQGFYLSKPLVELVLEFLQSGAANKRIAMGKRVVLIDRKKIFILSQSDAIFHTMSISHSITTIQNGWSIHVSDAPCVTNCPIYPTWSVAWGGRFSVVIPKGTYTLAFARPNACIIGRNCLISKWWNNHKIPIFLRTLIPVIWKEDNIFHEFLTGRTLRPFENSNEWIHIECNLIP